MRLGGEDLAPLFGQNAGNCHPVSPLSSGLVPGRRKGGRMLRSDVLIKI